MANFIEKFQDDVKKRFAAHIANTPEFVVKQLHRDGDVVKLWRCSKPQSSVCSFYVCSSVHCLMVYGDMGEYMWQRHRDMIPFIRGSIGSLNYFSEKVPNGIEIKTDYRELVEEWFDEVKKDRIDCGYEWGAEEDEALDELRDTWSYGEDVSRFVWDLYESKLCQDCEDIPNTKFYTFQYLWIIEALKWFVRQLDEGKVQPYEEPVLKSAP